MSSSQPNNTDSDTSSSDLPPTPIPQAPPTPVPGIPKADTAMSWGAPAGLHVRRNNDENLIIFRRAVGITGVANNLTGTTFPMGTFPDTAKTLEEGRGYLPVTGRRGKKYKATGIYAAVLHAQRSKRTGHLLVSTLIYVSHFLQLVLGATLTALGPTAGSYPALITLLGAINTVVAGVLALIKGQGLAERLRHDQAEFRKLQDWIEQTEALLAVGVIGRNRQEVGLLVQVAFKKYNAAKTSEENNIPENYIRVSDGWAPTGADRGGGGNGDGGGGDRPHPSLTGVAGSDLR